jgi:Carbohydrate family 9 binding domain-like
MSLVPSSFLFRLAYPCPYVKGMPREDEDALLDLPEACRIDNFAAMDGRRNFADVRLAWNELGLGLQVKVHGKDQDPQGDASRPRGSDGVTLWLDTRDARGGHRATRFCHQFHFLATGGGADHDEPVFVQTRINRALQDAPLVPTSGVPFQSERRKGGYVVRAFLPAAALNGFDPEQNARLGFYYAVRDSELGDQVLSVGAEFPYWEDPSLWSVLELMR